MENDKNEKNEHIHICNYCDFKCSYLSDWKRHITTRKHLVSNNGNNLEINGNKFYEKNEKNTINQCNNCKKEYKTFAGLWKHKKKCTQIKDDEQNKIIIETENNNITSEMIIEIIKQNQEFKDILLEQNKTIIELSKNGTTNINNSMNNSHNKTFNLQVFLN